MGMFRKVAETNDLQPGTARLVEIEGKDIALFNVDGEFHAIDNTCAHIGVRWPRGRSRAMSSRVLGRARPTRQRPYLKGYRESDI